MSKGRRRWRSANNRRRSTAGRLPGLPWIGWPTPGWSLNELVQGFIIIDDVPGAITKDMVAFSIGGPPRPYTPDMGPLLAVTRP